jgi:LAO/AO transport system kinase
VSSTVALEPADQALVDRLLAGHRRALARTITLIESTRRDHQVRAAAVLDALLPHAGRSIRVGVTGSPGVGKSTFIEELGLFLIGRERRVAVLAVDPSSTVSGGSILGDKTRMERLAREANAFIRPSPSGGSLGGVAEKTREAMLVCEAAGFDVIVVETVGTGQSETAVAGMVDVFVLLQLPNAGDELQAMKKGVVELADLVVITKADLDAAACELARRQVQNILDLLHGSGDGWRPTVLTLSAAKRDGIDRFWNEIDRFHRQAASRGTFAARRQRQAVDWMWTLIDAGLREQFRQHPTVRRDLERFRQSVADGLMTPIAAARRLLGALFDSLPGSRP